MSRLIFIYCENDVFEAELSSGQTIAIGSGKSDGLRLDRRGLQPAHITLTAIETGVHMSALEDVAVGGDNVTNRVLAAGDIVRIVQGVSLTFFEKRCDNSQAISLSGIGSEINEITIGRSSRADISLPGNQVSSNHAALRKAGGRWEITDSGSRNGTFLNGKRMTKAVLNDNAVIFIGGWKLRYKGGELSFINTLGRAALSARLTPISSAAASRDFRETAYPYFQKSPRLRPDIKRLELEILTPPRVGDKPDVVWLSVLLPPVMMIAVMIVVASMPSLGSASLLFTVPMSLIGIVTAYINYNAQMKKWREASKAAQDKYTGYLKEREAEISAAETAYITALDSVNPSPEICASIVSRRDRRLWERSAGDGDFLTVRVGTGTVASNVTLKLPSMQMSLEDDPLLKEAVRLKERHGDLSGVPVTIPLAEANIVGFTGGGEAVKKVVLTIINSVAAHHSYEDVKIAAVFPESEMLQWDFLRWLPHVWDDNRRTRLLACSAGEAGQLLRGLDDTLKSRSRQADENEKKKTVPHYLVVLADKKLAESVNVSLLPNNPNYGVTVLYAYVEMSLLPGECNIIVECGEKSGTVYDKYGGSGRVSFIPDKITPQMMDAFARSLAPVRFRSSAREAAMPDYVPLLSGLGVSKVEELDVLGLWKKSRPFESIAAPIGIRENGEVFAFDIHEKGMGPHGIVAGATRWGKRSSSPGEFHPQALTEPYVTLSRHTALVISSSVVSPSASGRII